MYKIAICIPTYKRPLLLENLIRSILECRFDIALVKKIDLVIVDNDISKSAGVILKLFTNLDENFTLHYYDYGQKGLSNVRNELIKKALLLSPDYLIFIDDDEYVSKEWINELLKTITSNNGDMAMGPVLSDLDSSISENISCWLQRPDYLNNTRLNFIRTGNLIINVKSLLKCKIWFDKRFNTTGGEDSYFGIQMIKKRAKVYWAADAIAYETVPAERANLRWIIRRYYNGANIFTYILKIEKEYFKLIKKILVSLIYLALGAFMTIFVLIPVRRKYWGILKVSEGLGGIAGLFSIKYYEYK